MRYTVTWTEDAQSELADVWLQSPDREAVAQASHQIDHELREDPETKGMPISEERLLYVDPLRVLFEVVPDDLIVYVTRVWTA